MSGLKNTTKRVDRWFKGKGYTTGAEAQARSEAKRQKELDELYSSAKAPDEEELKREARRKAAARRGSRVSTVLTDDKDTLG